MLIKPKYLLSLLMLLSFQGCALDFAIPSGKEQAQFYVKALTQGQKAYYEANGKFARSLEQMELNLDLSTAEYKYEMISSGKKTQGILIKAAAQKDGLPSYTGIILIQKKPNGASAVANICQTEQPSSQPPNLSLSLPFNQVLQCPAGSKSIQ